MTVKFRSMKKRRVTPPMLDVVEYLLDDIGPGSSAHAWQIITAIKRATPTVYGVLDKLEDCEWVTSWWEDSPIEGRPRRRMYKLTPNGTVQARALLAERRPARAKGASKLGWAFLLPWRGCTDGLAGGAR